MFINYIIPIWGEGGILKKMMGDDAKGGGVVPKGFTNYDIIHEEPLMIYLSFNHYILQVYSLTESWPYFYRFLL